MRKKILTTLLVACVGMCPAWAGETATLVKTRLAASKAVVPGKWHASLSKTKSYATKNGVPLIAVWSNGDACGHCVTFESACNSSTFKDWMKKSGCVFHFVSSADSGNGTTYSFCYKSQSFYPLIRVYWYKNGVKKVDTYTMGDTMDGQSGGTAGGTKVVAWLKTKLKNFKPGTSVSAPVKPYTIEFAPNGATNEMPSVSAKVGTARTLPANTFIRPDYSFTGWAKTATGAVAYKNKASVKNLTTVSNGVVTLYAKWNRTTFRTYYIGFSYTISMTDLKGWVPNKKVTGMKWNKTKGKWTGKPTKAGTFTIKFTKGKSSATRKVVVVKDSVTFADEMVASHVWAANEPITLDLTPTSHAGTPQSVAITGLPDGLSYADGIVSGASAKVGTFKVTVTIVSAKGQTLTRSFNLVIGVPDCCIGTFNGFIGNVDTNRLDELALLNRGTFRLSAPSSANLSAKIVTAKGTYSLAGLGWTINGDGTYTAQLVTATGKDVVTVTVGGEQARAAGSFRRIGFFLPSYGTEYEIWAQRAPFEVDANGAYLDPAVAKAMPFVMKGNGKWYFQAYQVASVWILRYATAASANLTLTVSADGTAKLAGKVGSYAVSAASAVFVFGEDVEEGFVRADFPTPISVKSGKTTVKKTLDIWLNLWFDRSNDHFDKRGEIIGFASVESFQ